MRTNRLEASTRETATREATAATGEAAATAWEATAATTTTTAATGTSTTEATHLGSRTLRNFKEQFDEGCTTQTPCGIVVGLQHIHLETGHTATRHSLHEVHATGG